MKNVQAIGNEPPISDKLKFKKKLSTRLHYGNITNQWEENRLFNKQCQGNYFSIRKKFILNLYLKPLKKKIKCTKNLRVKKT